MAFLLNNRPLAIDTPFVDAKGVQYPANWLRFSTPEEKAAVGITEVPDPPQYDSRFYWGYDKDGKLIPKDHVQLVEYWVTRTRQFAGYILQPTDWMVIREIDNGIPINPAIKTWRETIRLASGTRIAAIEGTSDTDALALYITSNEYTCWPEKP